MEIRTISPEDVERVATNTAREIPNEQIDAFFKSQYTGKTSYILGSSIGIYSPSSHALQISFLHRLARKSSPSAMNGSLPPRI